MENLSFKEQKVENKWPLLLSTFVVYTLLSTSYLVTGAGAQTVNIPLNDRSYNFIDRMEAKGIVKGLRNGTKPLSRLRMAEILAEIENSQAGNNITEVEREQLRLLKQEFGYELRALGQKDGSGRWHLFTREEREGTVYLDPVFRFSGRARGDKRVYGRASGAKIYGYIKDCIGLYLYARDTREWGKRITRWKPEDPQEGFWDVDFPQKRLGHIGRYEDHIDHDEVDANIAFKLPWLQLELGKGSNIWGPGYHGQLALSDWVPSYGQAKLSAQYGNWLDFTYIHAFLHSDIVDTLRSYETEEGRRRTLYRRKYLAGHRLEMTVLPGVDVGLSETVIYGDRDPEILYLIPIMFFWSAQHYLKDPDNLQMSGDVDINVIKGLKLYGSLFIDEIYTAKMFSKEGQRNQIGFQGGVFLVNPFDLIKKWAPKWTPSILLRTFDLIETFDLRAEYTRLNPCVYSHKFPINTFESYGYLLGHQIGQNADEVYVEANYRYGRPLLLSLSYQRIRKGEKASVEEQYSSTTPRFLSGKVKRQDVLEVNILYEPLRNLLLNVGYKFFSGENGKSNDVLFSVEYNY